MAQTPSKAPRSAGALLALSILAGAIVGLFLGQPSIGFLAGLGIGIVVTLLVWLLDRRKSGGSGTPLG
ncbi:MAG TPA: hypothetical protein VI381_02965 [Allosphingosinicella sp.]